MISRDVCLIQPFEAARIQSNKRFVRNKKGSMVKVGRTARELHLHVLRHVPEWRTLLALQ